MKVAIITLNYNGKKDTLEFLESLSKVLASRSEPTTDYQLLTIVVDNASSDRSVPAVHKKFPKVVILQTGANLGFAGGFNKGLEYAQIWGADYFLLINNDCLTEDGSLLDVLIKTLSDPKIGLVSPKIYFAKGFEFYKEKYTKDDLGKVIWFAGGKFDWDNISSIHHGIDQVDKGQFNQIIESEIFSGACVLIKKEVLEKVGVLNKDFFLYFEDSEFAKRVREAGFKIYYNGQISIYHKVSRSTGIGSALTDYYHTRNRLIFGMRYGKVRTRLALLREAVKLLTFGRPAQRLGVLDYYLGIKGKSLAFSQVQSHAEPEYPFKLSIGIVNYNTADLTKKLLQSIFKTPSHLGSGDTNTGIEVIVLDNGKVDPVFEKIKEYLLASRRSGPKIKYLKNEQNEGFAKGYNKTIKYALGEYFLMLNSDIEVLDESLSEIVKAADHFKGEASLGGKLIFPDGSNQDSAFHLPTLSGAFKEYFLAKKGSYFMFEPRGESLSKVEGLVMACMLIPKKVLNKVGLLDESSFIFFEDIEYARRLKKFKIPLYFLPAAKFIHHHGASTKKIGQEKAYVLLQEASQKYHGKLYYFLLSFVLKLGQKLGRVRTPVSRWTSGT